MRLSIPGSLRFALVAAVALTTTSCVEQTALLECDADNGDIQLPDGFCAFVDLTDFRPHARISFEINVADDGWSGTARHNQLNQPCSFTYEYDAGRVPGHGPVCHSLHVH